MDAAGSLEPHLSIRVKRVTASGSVILSKIKKLTNAKYCMSNWIQNSFSRSALTGCHILWILPYTKNIANELASFATKAAIKLATTRKIKPSVPDVLGIQGHSLC